MIFFDLDGTLYKTHETSLPPLRRLSDAYGIVLNADIEREYLCMTTEAFLNMAAPNMDASLQKTFRDELWNEELREIRANAALFDGMEAILKRLFDEGVLLAVCTMSGFDYVTEVLQKTGIGHYFQALLTQVKGKTKAMVLREYLDLHPEMAEGAMLIGDSWVDEEAAKANRIPFLCMTHGYDPTKRSQDVRLVKDAKALWGAIQRIRIFQQIEKDLKSRIPPHIIGITGPDASGKSAFASDLAHYFQERRHPCQLVRLDDFHQPVRIRRMDDSPEGYLRNGFDLVGLHAFLTQSIHTFGSHECLGLDLETDSFVKPIRVETRRDTMWIVEGVALFRRPLDELFQYRVVLDISFEEVLRRAKQRDVPRYGQPILERYGSRYIPAQKLFMSRYLRHISCDMIVDNEDWENPRLVTSIRHLEAAQPRFAVFRMAEEDLNDGWLDGFVRHQDVTRMCFVKDGTWLEKDASFTEHWNPLRLREIERGIRGIVLRGGKAVAAYVKDRVIGFACVEPERFADGYLNLDTIHVTEDLRGIGVGTALFRAICEEAMGLGGKQLYISAHPSVESQAFYRRMGCVLARTIHPELFAREPEDIHLEYALTRFKEESTDD